MKKIKSTLKLYIMVFFILLFFGVLLPYITGMFLEITGFEKSTRPAERSIFVCYIVPDKLTVGRVLLKLTRELLFFYK